MAKPLKKKKRRIVPRTMLVFGIAAILCTLYYMAVSLLLEKDWIPFPTKWWALSADIVVIVFTILAVIVLLMTCCAIVAGLRKIQAHNDSLQTDLRRLVTSQTQSEAILTQISENVLLSDSIKSVAFREKDRNVLTDAIYQDMRMERWNSALALTQELARCFGGREEARKLQEEINRYRQGSIEEKIDAAVQHIESLWMIHHYSEAQMEVDALIKLYPAHEKIKALEGETEKKHLEHKKQLLEQWDQAVKNKDIDRGVELLELLDQYLTPTEGAALEESARGIFRAKLHNMGVQFSVYVTEKNWNQALKIGKDIIEEFPNTRMAQEVRDKLDILESRVHQ